MPENLVIQTIEQIRETDKKIDKNNQIDEQTIINKIKQTDELFRKFKNKKLQEFKNKIPSDKYEKLLKELNNLEQIFKSDLERLQQALQKLKENQFSAYQKIIKSMQDKFWGLLEIKQWDTLRDIAVKYLWLPENWRKESYSWFELVEWLQKNENIDSERLQIGDIILIPAEYTILKSLLKWENIIDLKELFKNQNIKFNKEKLSDEEKTQIYSLLLQYFKLRWNDNKIKFILKELAVLSEKHNDKLSPKTEITKAIQEISKNKEKQKKFIEILQEFKKAHSPEWKDYSWFIYMIF